MAHREVYEIRDGVENAGIEYEPIMAALFSIRLALDQKVKDFKLSINDKKWNNFDDIVLEVQYSNNEKKIFAVQLKQHSKEVVLQPKSFCTGKKLNLIHYYDGFDNFNLNENVYLIISTTDVNVAKEVKFGIVKKKIEQGWKDVQLSVDPAEEIDFINTSHKSKIEKFTILNPGEINSNFFSSLRVISSQVNLEQAEKLITNIFKAKFDYDEENIVKELNEFIKKRSKGWNREYYKITKSDVLLKIIELLLSESITTPDLKKYKQFDISEEIEVHNKNKILKASLKKLLSIWNSLTNLTDLTVLSSCPENLTGIPVLTKLFNLLKIEMQEFIPLNDIEDCEFFKTSSLKIYLSEKKVTNKVTLKNLYVACWKTGEVPLIIKENKNIKKLVLKILELLSENNIKVSLILISKDDNFEVEFNETSKILRNLNDCKNICTGSSNIYDDLINYLPINIQNRYNCSIAEFLRNDEVFTHIKTNHILEMALNKLRVGKTLDSNGNKHKYLERTLRITVFNAEDLNSDGDILVIKNLSKLQICGKKNVFEFQGNFKSIVSKNPDRNVHLLNFNEETNYLEHVETKGSLKTLQNCQKSDHINDKCLYKNCAENVNLIIAQPGMGKTYLLKKLAMTVPPGYYSLYMTLGEHVNFFNEESNKTNLFSHFYGESETKNDSLTRHVFNYFLVEKKIFIFLDGFDEISPFHTEHVLEIMKVLRENEYKLFLTSRTNMAETIKKAFNTFPLYLDHLDLNAKETLLNCHFDNTLPPDTVKSILKWFEEIDSDFFGSPLAIEMGCEVYKGNEKNLKSINKFQLLERYVKKKIKLFQNKFYSCSNNVELEEQYINSLNKHKELSLKLFFDDEICKKVFSSGVEEFIARIKENRERTGIIIGISPEGLPIFVHRLIAEYLAAQWLLDNWSKFSEIMKQLFQIDKIIIRHLFDSEMSKGNYLNKVIMEGNLNGIKKILAHDKEILNEVDKAGRTPMHFACAWSKTYNIPGNKFDIKQYYITSIDIRASSENILDYLVQKNLNLNAKEKIFNEDCFYYAEITNSLLAIDKLLGVCNTYTLTNLEKKFSTESLLYYSTKYNFLNILKKLLPIINCKFESLKFGDNEQTLLHVAAEYGMYEILEQYLKHYKDFINLTDKYDQTALHVAAKFGHETLVNLLLDNNCDIDAKSYGHTPLFYSVEKNYINISRKLIESKCNIDIKDFNGCSPICYATNIETFELLQEKGASLDVINHEGNNLLNLSIIEKADRITLKLLKENKKKNKLDINFRNAKRQTALHLAVQTQNIEIAKKLIEYNANINLANNFGDTALHHAIEFKNKDLVDVLLKNNAKIELKNVLGLTAIALAVKKGNYEIYKLLEKHGAILTCTDSLRNTLLHYAVEAKSKEITEDLLHKKFDVNGLNVFGKTPAHCAIETGNVDFYYSMKHSIKDLNKQDIDFDTLLHKAIHLNYSDIAKDLIESGANVNIKNVFGRTPLLIAAKRKNYEVVKALLNHKANIHVFDNILNTALHFSVKHNSPEILDELLKNKINVNVRNVKGITPFHIAVENLDLSACLKLKERNAKLNCADMHSNTPLHVAVLNNAVKILDEFLEDFKCNINSINYQGRTPIALATEVNNINIFNKLIECNCNLTVIDAFNMNLIHIAVYYKSYEILTILLENHLDLINLEEKNNSGETALMLAIKLGDVISFKKLLEKEASLDIVDFQENTPLLLGFLSQNNEIIKHILKGCPDLNAKNWLGRTPIHYLAEYGDSEILKCIDAAKADLNVEDNYTKCPLCLSCHNRNISVSEWLIQNGAKPTDQYNKFKTKLQSQ